ncbi:MAG: FHA domain-containing protein, partial [Myxococcales bacterium]|nr:FHA domain-containing protein [Myxococcales bacterium]
MASKTISFRIFLHDQLVDTRAFEQEVIKLGRLASSHLRLEDEAVGRMHAVIEVGQAGEVRLIDLGSATGTAVNGSTIDRNQVLSSGDALQIGPYRLELAIADAVAVANSEPARAVAPTVNTMNAQITTTATAPAAPNIDLSKVEDNSQQVAEVITSYGRSILDVSHVGQARSRKRSATPLMALGGVLLAGGLGLFTYEVAQPWEAYSQALVEANQAHAEAPAKPGFGTGSLGMFLALMGLVPFV